MSHRTALLVVTALAGCSFSAKLNGSSLGGSSPKPSGGGGGGGNATPTPGPSGNGMLIVPDLTGKTAEQAAATLRAAGFNFERAEISGYQCADGDDTKLVAKETVCDQRPAAGIEHLPRMISVTFTIEHNTYEHGSVGQASEWRRMPDLVGKPIDVARTILARASLPIEAQFEILDDGADRCQPDQVCHTEPAPKDRKVLARKGRIYVGKAKAPTAPTTPTAPTGDTYF